MSGAQPHGHEDFARIAPGEVLPAGPNQKNGLYLFNEKEMVYGEDGKRIFAYRLSDGRPACGSRKPKKDGRCESPNRELNGRCRSHGGRSPRGPASPHWVHGGRSRYQVPPQLLDRYHAALTDPDLAHHRDSIALTDAMIQAALDNYEQGGTPALWKRLAELWTRLEVAYASKDRQKYDKAKAQLGIVIRRGASQTEREKHIMELARERRQHAMAETKRKQVESKVFTLESAYAFMVRLEATVRDHVKDENTLRAIAQDMAGVAGPLRGSSSITASEASNNRVLPAREGR